VKTKNKILIIIPARGGSKGIPEKNIRNFLGKPLIAYSILAAKKSKFENRTIVSTDNKKISNIAKKFGAESPFLRPKSISKDNSTAIDYVEHSLNFLQKENYVPDIIVILQPTSPIRNSTIIDQSINQLIQQKSDSVITVSKASPHPYWAMKLNPKKFLKPINDNFSKFNCRQKLPELYYPNGSVFTFWKKNLVKHKSILGKKISHIVLKDEESIDIDTPFDLFVAQMTVKYWNSFSKKFVDKN